MISRAPSLGYAAVWVVLALSLVATTGCPDSFSPVWRVDSYRLLAVRSEPAALRPGEEARLEVLDYAPPDRDVTYTWEWCPFQTSPQNRYRCPVERFQEQSNDGGDSGATPFSEEVLSLGSGRTARLPYPGTREQVRQICRRIQEALAGVPDSSPLSGLAPETDCEQSYDVSVRVRAKPDGGEPVVARKQVTLGTGAETLNSNPGHQGIEIRLANRSKADRAREQLDWVASDGATDEARWHTVPPTGRTPVVTGLAYQVRADVDASSLETWRPPAPSGSDRARLESQPETWVFRWFTSRGDLERNEQIFNRRKAPSIDKAARTQLNLFGDEGDDCHPPPPVQPDATATDSASGEANASDATGGDADTGGAPDRDAASSPPSSGRAPPPDPDCRLHVWSIIRDERQGVNWAEGRFRIVGDVD